MASRRKAREAALQMLYQIDLSGEDPERAIDLYRQYLGEPGDADEFTMELVRGWSLKHEEVDTKLREVSKHWRLERMARVDRNILRLGAFELIGMPAIPARVTLNEAVELAKRFGDENSPAFVNGVLDRIASDLRKA
jgi:N utilization substance protein B